MGKSKRFKRYRLKKQTRGFLKIAPILQPTKIEKPKSCRTISNSFLLTENDRLIYIFQIDDQGKVTEVINVSYDILVENGWVTIIRYDSEHGYLHRHSRISLTNPEEIETTLGVKKKGVPHTWLTWAIDDVKSRYLDYKKKFIGKSN